MTRSKSWEVVKLISFGFNSHFAYLKIWTFQLRLFRYGEYASSMYHLDLEIPALPKALNRALRTHYHQLNKEKRSWHEIMIALGWLEKAYLSPH
jgi:hypothetical protein